MCVTDCLPIELADVVLSMDGTQTLYERLREAHGLEVAGGRRFLEAVPGKRLRPSAARRSARARRSSSSSPSVGQPDAPVPQLPLVAPHRSDAGRDPGQQGLSGRAQLGAQPGDGQAIPDMGEG